MYLWMGNRLIAGEDEIKKVLRTHKKKYIRKKIYWWSIEPEIEENIEINRPSCTCDSIHMYEIFIEILITYEKGFF